MKYLKNFETTPQYLEYIEGEEAILPNVSCVTDDNLVYYNPEPGPLERALALLQDKGFPQPFGDTGLTTRTVPYFRDAEDRVISTYAVTATALEANERSGGVVFLLNGNTLLEPVISSSGTLAGWTEKVSNDLSIVETDSDFNAVLSINQNQANMLRGLKIEEY